MAMLLRQHCLSRLHPHPHPLTLTMMLMTQHPQLIRPFVHS